MHKILRFDSVGGASGDMILSCLIGLGADPKLILDALQSLPIEEFEIVPSTVVADGFRGIRTEVRTGGQRYPHDTEHHHRNPSEIRHILEGGRLPLRAKSLSLKVFERLAEVEAFVHGTSPTQIQFHELGALDSIVDIVGSCVALDLLEVERVIVGPLPLSRGTTGGAHGVLPLPVPATAELLKDWPVVFTDEPSELVTPTGAALLTTWHTITNPAGTSDLDNRNAEALFLERTACGFGHRQLRSRPNLLRAVLLRRAKRTEEHHDTCLVLEFAVDDMLPEWVGALSYKLLEVGALDVYTTPVQMKKNRPGTLVTVLGRPADREILLELLFRESTTFGIREYMVNRTILARRHEEVNTPYGRIRVKIGSWRGRDICCSPEYEDCMLRAQEHNVPLRTVYEAVMRCLTKTPDGKHSEADSVDQP